MFTIHEIANGLKEMVSEKKFVEAYQLLFADEAESIDPIYAGQPPLKGLDQLIQREKEFLADTEIHKISLSEPIVSGSYFTLGLFMDFTNKARGHMEVTELCVYKVADGKIVSQQFFIG